MTHSSDDVREALRTVWNAQGDASASLEEECSPTKTCRNMVDVTFDGFAEPGSDIGAAWRAKLAREGKLSTSGMCRLGCLTPIEYETPNNQKVKAA